MTTKERKALLLRGIANVRDAIAYLDTETENTEGRGIAINNAEQGIAWLESEGAKLEVTDTLYDELEAVRIAPEG